MVWEFRGDGERAAAALAEAVPLLQAAGNAVLAAWAQADLADILVWRGDLAVGVPMLDEALTRLRQTGADWLILLVLNQRGHAALAQRDLPRAAGCFRESITVAQTIQQTRATLGAVHGLAGVALALGQAERAAGLLGAVGAVRESLGDGADHPEASRRAHHGGHPCGSRGRRFRAGLVGWSGVVVRGGSGRGARDRRCGRDRGEGLTSALVARRPLVPVIATRYAASSGSVIEEFCPCSPSASTPPPAMPSLSSIV